MGGITWHPNMDEVLRRGVAQGWSFNTIGDKIGVAPNTAIKRARALGIERPVTPPKETQGRLFNEMRFADLLADGLSPQEAGDRVGYARGNSVLQRIRGKLGWQAV